MTEQNASKLRKKIGKLKHLVRHHDGVVASDSDVSPHLVVANIGVDNGIPKGDILNLFKNDSSSSSPTSVPTLHLGAGRVTEVSPLQAMQANAGKCRQPIPHLPER